MPSHHAFPRALLIVISMVMLAACGSSVTGDDGHDMHASCFRLVTGQGATLGLAEFTPGDVGNPVPSAVPPRPTRRWSEAAGWPGGKLPAAGDAVTIPASDVVLLDMSPPELASLFIAGALVFDRQDLELAAGSIELRGGLYVGSAAEPFTHRAVITVGTEERGEESDCFGRNYLGLVDATLEVYGNDDGPAWTRLAATAPAGATSITVDDATGWRAGDRIAIASTDFYTGSTVNGESSDLRIEERTITDIGGDILHFAEPLQYRHFGQNQTFGDGGSFPATLLESRAEVMRLTRNVTIRGHGTTADEAGGSYRFGAHVMALGDSRVRLDSVELTAMGQAGQVMRYPVHFHLMGNAAYGSFVRNSSLHHLYNRCITIHGSSGVLLQDNAAFDTFGHCYFFEDGAETGNVLKGNFGMMARAPRVAQRIILTDGGHMGPSIFWVTNPDNVLVGNVAASSEGSGFWYSLPEHPTGPSFDVFDGGNIWPRRTPLGRFEGNLAHSNNGDGLHVDRGPAAGSLQAETTSYTPRSNPADRDSKPVEAVFENFVAYKHRGAGAWFRGDSATLSGALLVDNAVGVTFASNASGLKDSVIVGESANSGTAERWEPTADGRPLPRPWHPDFAIRGFEFYDGDVYVVDSHFEGFEPNATRRAAALSILDYTSFSLSPLSHASGLTFGPDTNRVTFSSRSLEDRDKADADSGEDGYSSGLFIDADGSVTGTAGTAVTVPNSLLAQPGCSYRADWNAQLCQGRYAALTLRNLDAAPARITPVELGHSGSSMHTMFGSPNGALTTPNVHFRSLVPLGYDFDYDHSGTPPGALSLELSEAQAGDTLLVSIPYGGSAPHVYRDWWIDPRNKIESYASLSQLQDAPGTGFYHQDGVRLYLKLEVQDRSDSPRTWAHLTVCRRDGC